MTAHAVEIIAHRGASYDAPENTVAAFKLGWKQNADAVELDIWLSKDGKIVCLHDDNTKRTAGVDKAVADQTLAELRMLDAGSLKGTKWKGEKLWLVLLYPPVVEQEDKLGSLKREILMEDV